MSDVLDPVTRNFVRVDPHEFEPLSIFDRFRHKALARCRHCYLCEFFHPIDRPVVRRYDKAPAQIHFDVIADRWDPIT